VSSSASCAASDFKKVNWSGCAERIAAAGERLRVWSPEFFVERKLVVLREKTEAMRPSKSWQVRGPLRFWQKPDRMRIGEACPRAPSGVRSQCGFVAACSCLLGTC
jgi:hypothetical protein